MKTKAILRIGMVLMAAAICCGAMGAARAENDDSVYRIYTLVEPTDLELYRKLLPQEFSMPDRPMLMVMSANYRTYLEASIMMHCKTPDGEKAQYIVTMPLTEERPLIIGLKWGLPKYIADIELNRKGSVIKTDGRVRLSLEFTPSKPKRSPLEEEYLNVQGADLTPNRGLAMLEPHGEGHSILRIGGRLDVPRPSREWGMVKIHIDPKDPWAGLIEDGTTVAGLLQMTGAPMDASGGGGGIYIDDWKDGKWVHRPEERVNTEIQEWVKHLEEK